MLDTDYEQVLLVKPGVHVFRLPPRHSTTRAMRAAEWRLDHPDFICRLRIVSKGSKKCYVMLDDCNTGELFAACPVDAFPGVAVEAVADSSRYFVLRVVDEKSERTAFLGIGFLDRGDSFDFNVTLQDHFRRVKQHSEVSEVADNKRSNSDLAFKEGQTVRLNLSNVRPTSQSSQMKSSHSTIQVLPPAPGSNIPRLAPPPSVSSNPIAENKSELSENLLEF